MTPVRKVPRLQKELEQKVAAGRKLLVAYITAGLPSPQGFVNLYASLSEYADAIEIGIPFSDPIMDGPVIQEASMQAIAQGVTVNSSLELIGQTLRMSDTPAVVMTYFNLIHKSGIKPFAKKLAGAGAAGLIVADLPVEESAEVARALAAEGLAHIDLVAPATSEERARKIAKGATGWIYAVSRMGVTGRQESLADAAREVVGKVRPFGGAPVLLGVGISTPGQAAEAASVADGVIVGSAIVERVLAGEIEEAVAFVRAVRASLDELRD